MLIDILRRIWPEWKIEGQIGKGIDSTVYKAVCIDNGFKSYAAIKVISVPSDNNEIQVLYSKGLDINSIKSNLQKRVNEYINKLQIEKFFSNAPNIVKVEDYRVIEKTDQIGWDIFVRMELLNPLNTYISDKNLSEQDVIKIGCNICTALEMLHQKNIIHCNIKPENIFINNLGQFKIANLGLALNSKEIKKFTSIEYMSPESIKNAEYSPKLDIYSLGLVLYRLLNGNKLPFFNNELQMNDINARRNAFERRICGESLPVPCFASPDMANVILRACAFDSRQRFNSVTEMKYALMNIRNAPRQIPPIKPSRIAQTAKSYSNAVQNTNQRIDEHNVTPKKKSNKAKIIVIVSVISVLIIGIITAGIFIFSKYINNAVNNPSESVQQSGDDISVKGETVEFKHKKDDLGNEFAEITGITSDGDTVWVYTTDTYPESELSKISDIGVYNGNYYMVEDGTICAISVVDGSFIWKNYDFGGDGAVGVFDENGTLYICANNGPDLFVVDVDGNTEKKIISFDEKYSHPIDIEYENSILTITYAMTPSGNSKEIYVDLNDYSSWTEDGSISEPETDNTEGTTAAHQVSMADITSVSATSYLEESEYGDYNPSNIIDGDISNAWVEGVEGNGESESITLQLDGVYAVSGFTINSGYQKSPSLYEKNSRPSKLLVTFSDGNKFEIFLEDKNNLQKIIFDFPVETSSVTFMIEEVYAGSDYEDTAISEISLF